MMIEMMELVETGVEMAANGASWLFYEASTAQVILILAALKAIPNLTSMVEVGLYRMAAGMRWLMADTKRQFRDIIALTKVH